MLKQYAFEKLAANPARLAEVQTRFASFYGEWLARMNEKLKGSEQLPALSVLRTELQNLRAAWQWLVEHQDFDRLHQLLPAMILFNIMNDQRLEIPEFTRLLREMARILRPMAASDLAAAPEMQEGDSYAGLLALTLAGLRYFTFSDQNQEQDNLIQQESLQIVSSLPDSLEKAFSLLLNNIGRGSLAPQRGLDLCRQCVGFFTTRGDAWGLALAQLILADIANFGLEDGELARTYYQASLEGFSRLGNDWGKALCLTGLMNVEFRSGNLDEADRLGRQSLVIFSLMNSLERMMFSRYGLGEIAIKRGALDDARQLLRGEPGVFHSNGRRPLASILFRASGWPVAR